MSRRLISTGSPFERDFGYSRAVAQGEWCFVSGTTGFDYATMEMPPGAAAQAESCLKTIEAALGEAGFSLADIIRLHSIVTDRALVAEVGPVLGRWFAGIRPAATMVIADLIAPEMLIEIEATAYRT